MRGSGPTLRTYHNEKIQVQLDSNRSLHISFSLDLGKEIVRMSQANQTIPNTVDFAPLQQRLFDLKALGDIALQERLVRVYADTGIPSPNQNELARKIHVVVDEGLYQTLLQHGARISELKLCVIVEDSGGEQRTTNHRDNLHRRVLKGWNRRDIEKEISMRMRPALNQLFSENSIRTDVLLNNILTMVSSQAARIIVDEWFLNYRVVGVRVERDV